MIVTSEKQVRAILGLDGPTRFRHFVKRVVDTEVVWGLWQDGWALMENNSGARIFPLWPAREYAELAKVGALADYEPRKIPLDELLHTWIPDFIETGLLPGVFPTPEGKGVTPTPEELAIALREELTNYE